MIHKNNKFTSFIETLEMFPIVYSLYLHTEGHNFYYILSFIIFYTVDCRVLTLTFTTAQ